MEVPVDSTPTKPSGCGSVAGKGDGTLFFGVFFLMGSMFTVLILGEALKQLGHYREALGPLRRASDIAPSNIHVWLALGWCYKRLGRIDKAVEALEEAVVVEPKQAITHYNLACYLSLVGEKTRTLAHLAEALLLDPRYRELVDDEPDFDPLRSDAQFQVITSIIV